MNQPQKKLLRRVSFLALLCLLASAPARAVEMMPLEQVKPGMRGVARTVFAGPQIEEFELEVLGVLKNVLGPKQDIILVKLLGDKVTHTGVVAGMSGSPVFIDGKLVGAISLRAGFFTKEPIGGVTPIATMLRAAETEGGAVRAASETESAPRYPLPDSARAALGIPAAGEQYLVPIEAPLTFVGFHPQTIHRFAGELAQHGLLAVQGGGQASTDRLAPLEPGGAVSAALITGDLSIAATCTITHRDADQLYACGHPVLGYGEVKMPMTRAEIVTTVASALASFKIANIGEVIGTFEQDRRSAIVGRVGAQAPLIPVQLTLARGNKRQDYRYNIFHHPKLSPLLLAITMFNGIAGPVEYGEEMSYRVTGRLALAGHDDVRLDGMYSPAGSLFPDAFFVATRMSEVFGRVFNNPFEPPQIEGITLEVELLPERRSAAIENAWVETSEVRAGETLNVKVALRPYRGERRMLSIPVAIPPQAARGPLRILVSDAETLNRNQRSLLTAAGLPGRFFPGPRLASLEQLIALLNNERRNDRVYVSVLQPAPTLLVEDKILPNVPLSQLNVLHRQQLPSGTTVFFESLLSEASEPLGQVVAGSSWLQVQVR